MVGVNEVKPYFIPNPLIPDSIQIKEETSMETYTPHTWSPTGCGRFGVEKGGEGGRGGSKQ